MRTLSWYLSQFATLGTTISVAIFLLVLSITNGFEKALSQHLLNLIPHVIVKPYGEKAFFDNEKLLVDFLKSEKIVGGEGVVEGRGLIANNELQKSINIVGVVPDDYAKVAAIPKYVIKGKYLEGREGKVLLGSTVAETLGVGVQDKVTMLSSVMHVTPFGIFPRMKQFEVIGIFETKTLVDQQNVFMHIDDARVLHQLPKGAFNAFHLTVEKPFDAWNVAFWLSRSFVNIYAYDWSVLHDALYESIHLQKMIFGVIFLLLMAISAFNGAVSLSFFINGKVGDIAILRSLGASLMDVRLAFFFMGLVMTGVGGVLGIVLGSLLSFLVPMLFLQLESFLEITLMEVYFVQYLPASIALGDIGIIMLCVFILTILSLFYPLWRLKFFTPIDALREM